MDKMFRKKKNKKKNKESKNSDAETTTRGIHNNPDHFSSDSVNYDPSPLTLPITINSVDMQRGEEKIRNFAQTSVSSNPVASSSIPASIHREQSYCAPSPSIFSNSPAVQHDWSISATSGLVSPFFSDQRNSEPHFNSQDEQQTISYNDDDSGSNTSQKLKRRQDENISLLTDKTFRTATTDRNAIIHPKPKVNLNYPTYDYSKPGHDSSVMTKNNQITVKKENTTLTHDPSSELHVDLSPRVLLSSIPIVKSISKLNHQPVRILVVGGGPASLLFATTVKSLCGELVSVTIHEHRIVKDKTVSPPSLRWKTRVENVNRDEQVVTLQSTTFSSLPERVKQVIFQPNSYSTVWPYGEESSKHLGFPRNIQIVKIENHLLQFTKELGIDIKPIIDTPITINGQLQNKSFDFLVIEDGQFSKLRNHFIDRFGRDESTPFSLPEQPNSPIEDTLLALQVTCRMHDPETVILTMCQNRFLINTTDGEGYLYMRLTRHEAAELRARTSQGEYLTGCIDSESCNMILNDEEDSNNRINYHENDSSNIGPQFECQIHKTIFIPAVDRNSLLWPRVEEGLRLFNCELKGITVLRLCLTLRPRFTAEISELGTIPPVFAALIGDAASTTNFLPSRKLNHDIFSAVALARTIHTAISQFKHRRFIRSAELAQFEAAMSALQHRYKDIGWRAMVQRTKDGKKLSTIADIIAQAMDTENVDRHELLSEMETRVHDLVNRLSSRLPVIPVPANVIERLHTCKDETLNVLVESGTWETVLSGGPQVDIDSIIPTFGDENNDLKPSGQDSENHDRNTFKSLIGKDILSEESIQASFWHACQFSEVTKHTKTLAWTEAAREIRALLIRANVGTDVTINDIYDAVEAADRDESDRIDADEFVAAVKTVFEEKRKKVNQLGTIWTERFQNAADTSGKVACRTAAGISFRLASGMRPARSDLVDRVKLREIFEQRCENDQNLIDQTIFLDVAAWVMFGS